MSGPLPRVLKKGSPEATAALAAGGEAVPSAHERSREILVHAEAEVARLREGAADELRAARAAAVAEGHAEGLARAAASLALTAELREAKLAELDGVVVEVALEIARRILGRELATSPEAVLEVARRALRAAAGCGDVVLRIAPADSLAIREGGGELAPLIERATLTIAEDPALAPGDLVVETRGGRVDARIETQLEAFRRALRPEAG